MTCFQRYAPDSKRLAVHWMPSCWSAGGLLKFRYIWYLPDSNTLPKCHIGRNINGPPTERKRSRRARRRRSTSLLSGFNYSSHLVILLLLYYSQQLLISSFYTHVDTVKMIINPWVEKTQQVFFVQNAIEVIRQLPFRLLLSKRFLRHPLSLGDSSFAPKSRRALIFCTKQCRSCVNYTCSINKVEDFKEAVSMRHQW